MTVRDFFDRHVYGTPPADASVELGWQVLEEGAAAEGGIRRQLRLDLTGPDGRQVRITLLVHLPEEADASDPVPAFCGMNFRGNHTCTADRQVYDVTEGSSELGDRLHYAADQEIPIRGDQTGRWAYDAITERGWASITWCYLQLGPDTPELFSTGPHRLFSHDADRRDSSEWGAIGIWAWTMSRVLDALSAGMIPEIDPSRVIAHGHSRLGKTAIWAGVTDPRFAAVISNNSGCLGATITRDRGETPALLQKAFPHWVVADYRTVVERWESVFAGAPDPDLPDQPDLLALIAPRPLYVASASDDLWADPEGEFLSWQRASAAWPGGGEATAGDFPEPGEVRAPTSAPLGYHLRAGGHAVERFDWLAWLDFADAYVR